MAAFLLVAALTGGVLAFFAPLDEALNPDLYRAEAPKNGDPLLDPIELRDRVQRRFPKADIDDIPLDLRPRRSAIYWIDGRQTFVDPYTGRVLGSRIFGDLFEGRKNVMTFIYRLHYSLALGPCGTFVLGVVALLWTVDCFVGAYLTFPQGSPTGRGRRKMWLRRWLPAWGVKTHQLFSFVFTWHRASGLWLWGILFVFAWSAVALNLGQVYAPVMDVILPKPAPTELQTLPHPRAHPKLDAGRARDVGRRLLAAEAARLKFALIRERWLSHNAERGTYAFTVESTLDIDERLPATSVTFDSDSGRLLSFHASTGQNSRTTVDSWLMALHFAAVRSLGVVYRAFVSMLGALVAVLTITGVWIWWRKSSRRTAPRL